MSETGSVVDKRKAVSYINVRNIVELKKPSPHTSKQI